MEIGLRFRAALFCHGAFGFPVRGECSFAVRTLWSSSVFGTFRIFRMIPLNFLNSGVSRNCSGVSVGGFTFSQELGAIGFSEFNTDHNPLGLAE